MLSRNGRRTDRANSQCAFGTGRHPAEGLPRSQARRPARGFFKTCNRGGRRGQCVCPSPSARTPCFLRSRSRPSRWQIDLQSNGGIPHVYPRSRDKRSPPDPAADESLVGRICRPFGPGPLIRSRVCARGGTQCGTRCAARRRFSMPLSAQRLSKKT